MCEPRDKISVIIDAWPSLTDFAADICCGYGAARQMRRRESIPSSYWLRLVDAAGHRGIENVTLERLARLAAIVDVSEAAE